MTATEDTPPLQADLSDVLRLVAELATTPAMGRRGRQILFALSNAGHDIEKFDGLVIEGETYTASWRKEYAPCGCRDGVHRFTRDSYFGRSYWTETRVDAEQIVRRWGTGGHLVTHLVATTGIEVVR